MKNESNRCGASVALVGFPLSYFDRVRAVLAEVVRFLRYFLKYFFEYFQKGLFKRKKK
jgi:hypothetical protein